MQKRFKFTTTAIDRLAIPENTLVTYWDSTTPGLGLRVSKSGTKTYFFQRRVKGSGKERNISLARHGDPVLLPDGTLRSFPFGADDARTKAAAVLAQLLAGIDPVEEAERKREEAQAQAVKDKAQSMTLREAMLDYFAHRTLRPATRDDYQRFTERHLTALLDEPVASITRDRVLARVVELEQSSPTQAHKLTVYLSIFLNHAREKFATDEGGYPILPVNPVKRMRKLKPMSPPRPSRTRIPLPKVGACWNWLRKQSAEARTENERTAADWISFVLLTGCRRLESGSLKWSDVDLEARTITLREDVVKNHTLLVLPMSVIMHDLLTARKNPPPVPANVARRRIIERHAAEYVFATNGRKCRHITNAQATVEALSKIAGEHVHVHSLRRTFDSIAMECKIDGDIRRMLLNHKFGDVHSRHYSNDARAMADAVQRIADWIVQQGKIAAGDNVIMITDRMAKRATLG